MSCNQTISCSEASIDFSSVVNEVSHQNGKILNAITVDGNEEALLGEYVLFVKDEDVKMYGVVASGVGQDKEDKKKAFLVVFEDKTEFVWSINKVICLMFPEGLVPQEKQDLCQNALKEMSESKLFSPGKNSGSVFIKLPHEFETQTSTSDESQDHTMNDAGEYEGQLDEQDDVEVRPDADDCRSSTSSIVSIGSFTNSIDTLILDAEPGIGNFTPELVEHRKRKAHNSMWDLDESEDSDEDSDVVFLHDTRQDQAFVPIKKAPRRQWRTKF
jgi:hypothetical protein